MSDDWGYLIGATLGVIFYFGCQFVLFYFLDRRDARKRKENNAIN